MQSTDLPSKQARFVAEYLVDGNGRQAAIRAGYGQAGAHVAAARLLKNDKVLAAVRRGQREISDRLEMSRERVVAEIVEAIDVARAAGDAGAMIRGWSEVGRLMGFYQQHRAVKIDVNITAKRVFEKMETLSDAELVRMAAIPAGT